MFQLWFFHLCDTKTTSNTLKGWIGRVNVKGKRKPTKQHRNFNKESETLKGSAHENSRRGWNTKKWKKEASTHQKDCTKKIWKKWFGERNRKETKRRFTLGNSEIWGEPEHKEEQWKHEKWKHEKRRNGPLWPSTPHQNTEQKELRGESRSREGSKWGVRTQVGTPAGSGGEHPSATWVQPKTELIIYH